MISQPYTFEREYMTLQHRLFRELGNVAVDAAGKRQDSEELIAFLGFETAAQLLDQQRLRRRLRDLARRLTVDRQSELSRILGRPVAPPTQGTLSRWVDEQATVITVAVENWLLSASQEVRASHLNGVPLALLSASLQRTARVGARGAANRAVSAILSLNQQIIQEVAEGSGSTHYRWITEGDSRVRPHHNRLDDRVFAWDDPPLGGGTEESDRGHPGSGFGCRCVPHPFTGDLSVEV